jgi:hypothetical protein
MMPPLVSMIAQAIITVFCTPCTFLKTWYADIVEWIRENARRIVTIVIACLALFWILRGCIPGLNGSLLPSDVVDTIEHSHVVCIDPSDTPIWPGEPRQPECGRVNVKTIAKGVLPSDAAMQGISRAVCYTVAIENPYWTTQGTTRHEVNWQTHAYNKVAVYQNGAWQLTPDREDLDEQLWSEYACPELP